VDLEFLQAFGLLLIAVWLCLSDSRRTEDRRDRRERESHERRMAERREFGYDTVEEHSNNRSFRRFIKQ
jgi:hypothetical protein